MISKSMADLFIYWIIKKKKTVLIPFLDKDLDDVAFYDPMVIYWFMVGDTVRMQAYQRAIAEGVKEKVVVEIGTGALAPLAMMCAHAGASKVYAIEGNPKSFEKAKAEVQKAGLEDKIEVIKGLSSEVSLPEKAEVLVHELIGPMGSDEGMAAAVLDAKIRLLRKDAAHIPLRCITYAVPVRKLNFNLISAVVDGMIRLTHFKDKVNPLGSVWNYPETHFMAEPLEFENIDFQADFALEETRELKFSITQEGHCDGFLFWCLVEVSEGNTIDTLSGTHWPAIYIPVGQDGVHVSPGEVIALKTYKDLAKSPKFKFEAFIESGDGLVSIGTMYRPDRSSSAWDGG